MALMTIFQDRSNIFTEIVLSPNGVGCVDEFTPSQGTNWQCVDDDPTAPISGDNYNQLTSFITAEDFFDIPDVSGTYFGTIHYLKLTANALNLGTNAPDNEFKLAIDIYGTCTNKFYSDNKHLVSTYSTYTYYWNTNPSSGTAWTWALLDTLQIGYLATANSMASATSTLTIRPNGTGNREQHLTYEDGVGWKAAANTNYTYVDDEIPDYEGTAIGQWDNAAKYDEYNLEDHTTETGVISGVTVYALVRRINIAGTVTCNVIVRTGGTSYLSDTFSKSTVDWELFSWTWDVNPNTLVAWTWADIDALEAGIKSVGNAAGSTFQCTQLYVVVSYLASPEPDIRITRLFATIGYTGSSATCYLPKPEIIETSHDRQMKMLNFWNGEREVYGFARSKHTTVMRGKVWDFYDSSRPTYTACEAVTCVRDIANTPATVALSNTGVWLWDIDYRILSFGWRLIGNSPAVYDWILQLEKTT